MKAALRLFGRLSFAALLAVAGTALGGAGLVATATTVQAQSASHIVVRGNRRIDASTVRSYFAGAGGKIDVDAGIKRLYATGMFSDVRVAHQGGTLVVTVNENQVINQVAFEGNKHVKDAILSGVIDSKARGPFSPAVVQGDVQRIKDAYLHSGYDAAQVSAATINLPNGRVNLVFQVNEGGKTKIKEINFVGNKAFSAGTLRDQLVTSRSNFLSFLKNNDVYDPDRLNADLEKLRQFYLNHGYADMRVVSSVANYDPKQNAFFITITVDEGQLYRFGKVSLESSVPDVKPDRLRHDIETSQGSVYDASAVQKSVEDMSVDLAKSGYAFAQVRPRGERDYEHHTISVDYVVEEGARVYVERINIHGNTRTRDYVIRREFDLNEGDAYNQALIDRAERRLKNLGFFKSVKITATPGSAPDRVIVDVAVVDQPTGQFTISGGYSTADGLIAEVGVGEKNFMGRGEYIHVGASLGQYSRGGSFSFTEPYFLGRRVSAGIDLSYLDQDNTIYSSYDIKQFSGTLRLGVPITEEFTVGVDYQFNWSDIRVPGSLVPNNLPRGACLPTPAGSTLYPNCASVALLGSQGNHITSLVGYSLTYNTLDNVHDPRKGIYAEFHQDIAGLGGDARFLRETGDIHYYHELPHDMVGMARLQGGNIVDLGGGNLYVFDQFFKGQELVRGFAPMGIGPRDIRTNQFDPIGATTYLGGTLELQFPLFGVPRDLGLRGAIFADAGTAFGYDGARAFDLNGNGTIQPFERIKVWDTPVLRSSVGVSLLWNSPLGPLRFNYAFVLSKGRYDDTQAFSFSGGTSF
ncbi:MAG TPA: outer membrane protein assembly factor BamA [Hyphomicrobiales bacterium]|nr:outer membrane protein assembly factor BamA [Hyphomicrobiales bacterium]